MTSDLCIVLSLYESRKRKKNKNDITGVALFKSLIWILFLYPNDVVYFDLFFCKLNLNDICKNV